MLPVKRDSTGSQPAQTSSHFVASQLSPEEQHLVLSSSGRPTGDRGDLEPQIFPEFYLFYLKLYLSFTKIIGLAIGNTSSILCQICAFFSLMTSYHIVISQLKGDKSARSSLQEWT